MILSEVNHELTRRAYGFCVRNGRYGNYPSCRQSLWRRLGRWILIAILLFLSFLVISVTLCCIARRRYKQRRNAVNPSQMTSTSQPTYDPRYQQQYAPSSGVPQQGGQYQSGVSQPPNAYVR